ncbi:hypothetical protein EUGRSUZ_G01857 [Eucalyptus grandis]|uniref:Uncharacterized protein n=2 Tax=Eucalyptus grandis TaxID=71139 RepID=A0ACC3K514_EUCGR|nr:hypothetical protein EUGRSUZ_G01857 [Eucalyptus grandis]
MKNLKRKIEQLEDKEADLKKKMKLEFAKPFSQMKLKTMVTKCIEEATGENMQLVERLTREVEQIMGKKLPQTLFIQAEPVKTQPLLQHKLVVEAIQRNIELVWGCLMENRASNLGISGMGGVGKTTTVEHLHDRLLKNGNFDIVIFSTMSQNFSIYNDMEEERVRKRAAKLSKHLSKKSFVLILDDVWEHFKLQDVGIPDRADGCKLVLTTRSSKVCARMGCIEIKIRPLCEEEAWNLFVEHLGSKGVLGMNKIEKVAKAIVEKCAGFPLAIIAMARSMRGEERGFVWEDTLEKLKDPNKDHTEMGERVLPLIEFSLDEGLIDELHAGEKQYTRGLNIISKLQDAFLLEVSYRIKMHDLLREMALHIMSTTSIIQVSMNSQGMPDEERWTSDLKRVSLMNRIDEIPQHILLEHTPDSFFKQLQGLKVLNLSGSKITELPSSVSDLVNLRALVLCECYRLKLDTLGCIKLEAVQGLQMLANLRYLDLFHTGEIGKLQHLKIQGRVNAEEMTELKALKFFKCCFDIIGCNDYQIKVDQEKPSCYVELSHYYDPENCIHEHTSTVDVHCCNDPIVNVGRHGPNLSAGGQSSSILIPGDVQRSMGSYCDGMKNIMDVSPLLKLELLEINERENLQVLCGAADEREVIDEPSYSLLFPCLKKLNIQRCPKLKYLFGHGLETIDVKCCGNTKRVVESEWIPHFPNLKEINVWGCKKMVEIVGRPPPCMGINEWENVQVLCEAADKREVINGHSYSLLFPCLKKLNIQISPKLKYLFGHGCKLSLPCLRAIVIDDCEEIEGITAAAARSPPPPFPSLEKIDVKFCGNMKRVVESEWLLHFPSLKEINVWGCKKMVDIIGWPPPCMPVDTAFSVAHLQVECCNIQKLLPQELLPHLWNPQRIHVNDCAGMEEIVSRGSASTSGHIPSSSSPCPFRSLPRLKHLLLENLPHLRSICESTISCPSIK